MKGLWKEDLSSLAHSYFYAAYFGAMAAMIFLFIFTFTLSWLLCLVVLLWFFNKINQDRHNPFFRSFPFSAKQYVSEKYLIILLLVVPIVAIPCGFAAAQAPNLNVELVPTGLFGLNMAMALLITAVLIPVAIFLSAKFQGLLPIIALVLFIGFRLVIQRGAGFAWVVENISTLRQVQWICLGISLVCLLASYLLSMALAKKKGTI